MPFLLFIFISLSHALDVGDYKGEGLVHVNPNCGICGDTFQNTHSPLSASLSANSSTRLPFGLRLPCPNQHTYCVGCLSQYIISKLDPEGAGAAPEERIVFPIRCPECPSDLWMDGVQDDIAERILTKDRIALWVGN
jgi:predicted Zn-ribbon and HTH transcriptional regulator